MSGSTRPGTPLLGGLLRYNPDPNLTGVDRMRILGATLQDMGNGGGSALSAVHDDVYGRIQENQAQNERRQRMGRLFDSAPRYQRLPYHPQQPSRRTTLV